MATDQNTAAAAVQPSIDGTLLGHTLDQARQELWEAQGIIESVAAGLRGHFIDWPKGFPQFHLALDRAASIVGDVTDRTEPAALEITLTEGEL